MKRLGTITPGEETGKVKDMFNAVYNQLGAVPNMVKTMANSPALLEAYLNFSGALGAGKLGAKTGELIAMAVAESNSCNYCLSAHQYIGEKLLKLDSDTLAAARSGNSVNPKTDAILKFAKLLVSKKGLVNDEDVNALKAAGISDGELAEVVGNVALNIFTNYFNNTAETEIEFPLVQAGLFEVAQQ